MPHDIPPLEENSPRTDLRADGPIVVRLEDKSTSVFLVPIHGSLAGVHTIKLSGTHPDVTQLHTPLYPLLTLMSAEPLHSPCIRSIAHYFLFHGTHPP